MLKDELIIKPSAQAESKQYHDDCLLMEEIEKDVKRTRVELHFFYMAVDRARTSKTDIERLEK